MAPEAPQVLCCDGGEGSLTVEVDCGPVGCISKAGAVGGSGGKERSWTLTGIDEGEGAGSLAGEIGGGEGSLKTPKTGEGGLLREEPKREEGECGRYAAAEGVHSPPLQSTGAAVAGDWACEFGMQPSVTCGSMGVEKDGSCTEVSPE